MNVRRLILLVATVAVVSSLLWLLQHNSQSVKIAGPFQTDVFGLNDAKKSKEVILKNGDTYSLTASIVKKKINGKDVKMLSYNGSIPGPVIRVGQGATVSVVLKNETDVSTSLHSHGVRVLNKFDGTVGLTQREVKVGETFTYRLTFPDAGAYWYHPHFREDYAQPLGLYGMFLVTPRKPDYYAPANREEAITIGDIAMNKEGILRYSREMVDHTLMGRYGNVFLVNGVTDYRREYSLGEVVRFHIVNVSSTRVYNLTMPGAQIKLVGSDGGTYQEEVLVDSVVLSPSERTTIDVLFGKPGTLSMESISPAASYKLATFIVSDSLTSKDYSQEFGTMIKRNITVDQDSIDAFVQRQPDKNLSISLKMTMGGMGGGHNMGSMGGMMHGGMETSNKIEWEDSMNMMNQSSSKGNVKWRLIEPETRRENTDISWSFKKGDMVKIRINNDAKSMHPMQHPIHIHGQRFLVLSTNDVPNTNLVWKDTALVQTGDTVDLLVEMSNPGAWMLHCHIPEHMESGMMSHFTVI